MKKIGKLKTYTSKEIKDSYVSIGFECLDRDLFNADKCYDPLAKTGVKYARCQTGWAKTEKEKGVYDFAWLDNVVDNLLARGVKPWFNVGYGNPLYMEDAIEGNPTCVGCVPIYYGEEATTAWFNYVEALTIHFKDRITHYEIWNEPDISSFWYPSRPDPVAYANFLNDTASVVKKVFPNAKTGGCTSSAHTNYPYLSKFFSNVNSERLDFFSVHTYSTMPELSYPESVAFIKEQLYKNNLTVELWQGEAGYPAWAYAGHHIAPKGIDDERPQAVYQLRRYFLDVYHGMKRSSFFQIADMWEKPYAKAREILKKPAGHGILKGYTYEPRKSYETITYLSAIFSGDVVSEKDFIQIRELTDGTASDIISCQTFSYRKNGYRMFAYYWPLEIGKEHGEKKSCVRFRHQFNDPIIVDPYTGEVFSLEWSDIWVQGKNVYFDCYIPIKDYPLIITEKEAFEIIED